MELIALKKNICTGCMACVNVCPEECIGIKKDELGFDNPKIDLSKCIDCNACNNICPAIKEKSDSNLFSFTFAAKNTDEDVRKISSSGGVFSVLAEKIIDDGGVVFGAKFDENMVLRHIPITDKKDIETLRGSKYLQSTIKDIYSQIERYINGGKKVLFCGTPCQAEGIRSHFASDLLTTCAVVCHGVPSNAVFADYVKSIEKANKTQLIDIDFRNKNNSWRRYDIVPKDKNGAVSVTPVAKDKYMKGFIEGYYMRRCCHNCPAKPVTADVLLGDYWGVEHYHKDMDDDMGTSAVFTNDKGYELLKSCANIELTESEYENAVEHNKGVYSSAKPNPKRNEFIVYYTKNGYKRAMKKYLTPDGRVKYVIKKVLNRLGIIDY